MSFMQQQVTERQEWIEVDTTHGTEYIPAELVGMIRDSETQTHPLTVKERERIISKLSPYCEGTVQEWRTIKGFGARLSAPGYMDCTEWTVFDTAKEAQEYLDEYYPEEEEECEIMEIAGAPSGEAIGMCKCGKTIYKSRLAGNIYHAIEDTKEETHPTGCICADCSGAELTADND